MKKPSSCSKPSSRRAKPSTHAPQSGAAGDIPTPAARPRPRRDGPSTSSPLPPTRCSSTSRPTCNRSMPTYQGDLELINHSAGSLTSQAYHKRWNRKNELLADAAEKASVAAAWIGGRPYPQQRLNDAWTLVLGGQFHDTGAGTATAPRLRVRPERRRHRRQPVRRRPHQRDAIHRLRPRHPRHRHTDRRLQPAQHRARRHRRSQPSRRTSSRLSRYRSATASGPRSRWRTAKSLFLAKRLPSDTPFTACEPDSAQAGDKRTQGHAQLPRKRPLQRQAQRSRRRHQHLRQDAQQGTPLRSHPPRHLHRHTEPVARLEHGLRPGAGRPARLRRRPRHRSASSKTAPSASPSKSPATAEGSNSSRPSASPPETPATASSSPNPIDWHSNSANLKAVFPLTAANPNATYNEDIGTIQRPTAFDRQFEVGVPPLDRPHRPSGQLRRHASSPTSRTAPTSPTTTPSASPSCAPPATAPTPKPDPYTDQANQDWGHHEILFGLAGHAGDWRQPRPTGRPTASAPRSSPSTPRPHPGALGKTFSLVNVSNPRVRVLALKKAELSDEIILRLVELDGEALPAVAVNSPWPRSPPPARSTARNSPSPVPPKPSVNGSTLTTSFTPYQPRTFALKLAPTPSAAIASGIPARPAEV